MEKSFSPAKDFCFDGVKVAFLEKSRLGKVAVTAAKGGNVSDLGGHYNELVYFCDKASKGESIEKTTVAVPLCPLSSCWKS